MEFLIQYPNGNFATITPGETIDRPFVYLSDKSIVATLLREILHLDANSYCVLTDHEFTMEEVRESLNNIKAIA